jgi:hypothetical protein
MRELMDEMVAQIKNHLNNSVIAWHINPHMSEPQMRKWWSYFADASYIDLLYTSSWRTRANLATIEQHGLAWRFMHKLTGKFMNS